jgi:hypothetical protein
VRGPADATPAAFCNAPKNPAAVGVSGDDAMTRFPNVVAQSNVGTIIGQKWNA